MPKNFEYNDGSQGIIRGNGGGLHHYTIGFGPRGSKNALNLVVRLNT